MPSSTAPLRPLLLLAVVAVLAVAWRAALPADGAGPAPTSDDRPPGAPSAPAAVPAGAPTIRLDARDCFDAGYLCEGLLADPEPRVLRWGDGTDLLVVHVDLPGEVDAGRARALQRAAAAGIREWQGNPFELRVDVGPPAEDTDVRVTWTRTLSGRELGRVSSRWIRDAAGWRVEITRFALATHSPGTGRALTPAQVELTAAHEMGHVLGLPHSDDRRDVMFPLNTGVRLTSRDFRTLRALYALPVGARLELDDGGG